LIIVTIFAVSCSEESLDLDPNQESSTVLAKSGTAERDKLLDLAQGLAPAIKQYNIHYKQENKFFKKYGSFDKENVFGVKLPQYSEDVMLIIPFASKNLKKNKILIAYYKNGERQYKIFTKKKHKEKKRERIEEGILTHLDFIFEMSENETEGNQSKTVLSKNCGYTLTGSSGCAENIYTSCADTIIVNSDKMLCDEDVAWWDLLDNVNVYSSPAPVPVYSPLPSYSPPEDNDPDTTIDECDYWDYDCNDVSGGGTPDVQQAPLSLNTTSLSPSQKNLVNQALLDLKKDCLGFNLTNSLFGSVNVAVDGVRTKGFPAIYDAINNTIYFRSNNDIGSTLGHELFHAYQQQLYGILDDIHYDPGHVGGSNIEFESVAIDMLYSKLSNNANTILVGQLSYFGGAMDLDILLDELLIAHPNGNIGFLDHIEIHDWFEALTKYQQSNSQSGVKSMHGMPINPQLHPDALVKLLDTYFKSNCK
jgi:hypothetical protein